MKRASILAAAATTLLVLVLAGCGSEGDASGAPGRGPGGGPPDMFRQGASSGSAAVPVEVALAERKAISQHLETNGALTAEHEVDLVARVAGPITELIAEEGMEVAKGQLLAQIDDREASNQVAVAQVSRDEARRSLDRAQVSWDGGLISREAYDAALSALETAETQLESARIQLGYTRIEAPFAGVISTRHVKLAEHVQSGQALFRICDFTPLLCPIEVPERQLRSLHLGQRALLSVEAFAGDRFDARVLRISPTVNAATGTITVTLDVDGRGRLRPGMFASVALELATHHDAVVVPKTALVLDSIGDTIFVKEGDLAARREVQLGFRAADEVEVLDGLTAGEQVIVLGQEGLSHGTPVMELGETTATQTASVAPPSEAAQEPPTQVVQGPQPQPATTRAEPGTRDEAAESMPPPERRPPPSGLGGPGRRPPGAGPPPQMLERLRNATPEQLERFKQRMRDRGLSDEQIEQILSRVRGDGNRP